MMRVQFKPAWIFLALLLMIFSCRGPKEGARTSGQTEMVDVDGVQIFTRSMGEGEPILVVHGGPGLDHGYFLPQMEGLARQHRLIFFDQRCSGKSQSDLDPEQMRLDNFIADIDAVRAHYGLEKVHLLGHSFGGLLAMNYAIKHPERLQSLILSNSQGGSSDSRAEENARLARRTDEAYQVRMESIQESEAFQAGEADAYEDFFRHMFSIEFFDQKKVDALTLDLPANFVENTTRLQYLYVDLASYDLHAQLEQLEVPVLILYGDHEPLGEIAGPRLDAAFPQSEMRLIPECGHFPFIENPKTYFEWIRNFIQKNSE